MTASTTASTAETGSARRDVSVMALIGLSHATSHFFQLAIPAVLIFLKDDLGASYTQLGAVVTTFYFVSGLFQAPCGFLVDRIGARRMLLAGMTLLAGATMLYALAPVYWLLFPAAILAGMGNSVYHPADYSILTANVSRSRLGKAYSVHSAGGNLGWAAAPLLVFWLADAAGWRAALAISGGLGLLVALCFARLQKGLRDRPADAHPRRPASAGADSLFAPILHRAVILCFLYFIAIATTAIALNSFMPVVLNALHGLPPGLGASVLASLLIAGVAGMLAGGVLADRVENHDGVIAGGLLAGAVLLLAIIWLPPAGWIMIGVTALAGFAIGVTTPSRDMLVRRYSTPESLGRVFGFVYSGLDVGAAFAPFVAGWLLDHGAPGGVLWFAAGALVAGIGSVALMPARRPEPA